MINRKLHLYQIAFGEAIQSGLALPAVFSTTIEVASFFPHRFYLIGPALLRPRQVHQPKRRDHQQARVFGFLNDEELHDAAIFIDPFASTPNCAVVNVRDLWPVARRGDRFEIVILVAGQRARKRLVAAMHGLVLEDIR